MTLGSLHNRTTGRLRRRRNVEKMERETVPSQSYATSFRHSAVLSFPAFLLRKLPTILHATFLSQGQELEGSCVPIQLGFTLPHSLVETISLEIWEKPLSCHAKSSLWGARMAQLVSAGYSCRRSHWVRSPDLASLLRRLSVLGSLSNFKYP